MKTSEFIRQFAAQGMAYHAASMSDTVQDQVIANSKNTAESYQASRVAGANGESVLPRLPEDKMIRLADKLVHSWAQQVPDKIQTDFLARSFADLLPHVKNSQARAAGLLPRMPTFPQGAFGSIQLEQATLLDKFGAMEIRWTNILASLPRFEVPFSAGNCIFRVDSHALAAHPCYLTSLAAERALAATDPVKELVEQAAMIPPIAVLDVTAEELAHVIRFIERQALPGVTQANAAQVHDVAMRIGPVAMLEALSTRQSDEKPVVGIDAVATFLANAALPGRAMHLYQRLVRTAEAALGQERSPDGRVSHRLDCDGALDPLYFFEQSDGTLFDCLRPEDFRFESNVDTKLIGDLSCAWAALQTNLKHRGCNQPELRVVVTDPADFNDPSTFSFNLSFLPSPEKAQTQPA